ncbi:MAG: phosphate-starvation-inducible PsiE family protein [Caulobacteraceae bacterium]
MTETPTREAVKEALSLTSVVFEVAERAISFAIGAFLTVAAIVALLGAAAMMWRGVSQPANLGHGAGLVFGAVEQMLFVLMLVEILHTVRRSIEQSELACEPFLIVGLIATVRRMLVVTLESSDTVASAKGGPSSFEHSMIELGVLGALILVLVSSIFILRRIGHDRAADLLRRGPARTRTKRLPD